MTDFTSGLGSAAGDLAGSVVSGLFGRSSAKRAMKFEEYMSSTAYQRAALDLEKAGLNRVLALGSPASTPNAPSPTIESPKLGTSFQAGSSASAQRRVQAETEKLLQEQQKKTREETRVIPSQMDLNDANATNARAQAAAALTASKRGSGVGEISAAIADLVRQMRDPKSGGVVPTLIDKLPGAILGDKGVNSAKKVGSWLHGVMHGSPEEQSLRIKRKWDKIDAATSSAKQHHQSRPSIRGGSKRGSR